MNISHICPRTAMLILALFCAADARRAAYAETVKMASQPWVRSYVATNSSSATSPVTSVNGQTGAVVIAASDVGALSATSADDYPLTLAWGSYSLGLFAPGGSQLLWEFAPTHLKGYDHLGVGTISILSDALTPDITISGTRVKASLDELKAGRGSISNAVGIITADGKVYRSEKVFGPWVVDQEHGGGGMWQDVLISKAAELGDNTMWYCRARFMPLGDEYFEAMAQTASDASQVIFDMGPTQLWANRTVEDGDMTLRGDVVTSPTDFIVLREGERKFRLYVSNGQLTLEEVFQ